MSGSPPEAPVIFIDRNSGGRTFRDLLTAKGLEVVLHDEVFRQTVADEDWLSAAGAKGWVVITGDNATTASPLFLDRLSRSRTFVFILKGLNGASPAGKADCILNVYPKIQALVRMKEPPAIWRVGRDGVMRSFEFQRVLVRMRIRRRA